MSILSFAVALSIFLNSNITVVVTYFSPFGVERGVGPNVPVYAFEIVGGWEVWPPYFCPNGTNSDSACVIENVPSPGTYRVIARYDDGNPFWHFECEQVVDVDQPQEFAIVQCLRRWDTWFPHINSFAFDE